MLFRSIRLIKESANAPEATFHAARLDGVAARLLVNVLSDAVSGPTRLYRFTLHAENIHAGNIQAESGPLLLQGRAVVQLTPPRAPSVP